VLIQYSYRPWFSPSDETNISDRYLTMRSGRSGALSQMASRRSLWLDNKNPYVNGLDRIDEDQC